jgi:large subunit ribosomal protein L29
LKKEEIRTSGTNELLKQLDEAHHELFNLRIRASTRQLANHREIPRVRKKIARIKTIIRARELGRE